MSVWVTLLSFSVSMTGGIVRVVGCGGVVCVWGVWLGVYESGWWGVCSEDTQPPTHLTTGHGWWVGGLVGVRLKRLWAVRRV